mmetsp:Transcript_21669/g.51184  ORF Transcript_21669/g.51184 Transcript_21669/m.51184 type:complete len:194 (-) Transcript_21669:755-1336(-)
MISQKSTRQIWLFTSRTNQTKTSRMKARPRPFFYVPDVIVPVEYVNQTSNRQLFTTRWVPRKLVKDPDDECQLKTSLNLQTKIPTTVDSGGYHLVAHATVPFVFDEYARGNSCLPGRKRRAVLRRGSSIVQSKLLVGNVFWKHSTLRYVRTCLLYCLVFKISSFGLQRKRPGLSSYHFCFFPGTFVGDICWNY